MNGDMQSRRHRPISMIGDLSSLFSAQSEEKEDHPPSVRPNYNLGNNHFDSLILNSGYMTILQCYSKGVSPLEIQFDMQMGLSMHVNWKFV